MQALDWFQFGGAQGSVEISFFDLDDRQTGMGVTDRGLQLQRLVIGGLGFIYSSHPQQLRPKIDVIHSVKRIEFYRFFLEG